MCIKSDGFEVRYISGGGISIIDNSIGGNSGKSSISSKGSNMGLVGVAEVDILHSGIDVVGMIANMVYKLVLNSLL